MTLNERKALRNRLNNGGKVMAQDMLNAFFLPEDQDAFARSMGYSDAAQMCYYEDMASESPARDEVPPMTDREVDELARVSSEEVYSDDGMTAWADMAGVY